MKLILENWRKFIAEEESTINLPWGSNVRYNIQSGGELSLLDKFPHPFSKKYKFIKSEELPPILYFGGPSDMSLEDITVGTRKGGIGAPRIRKKEAGFYVTENLEDAEEYAEKNPDGKVYKVTLNPDAKVYSYSGDMKPERSWIVNFSEEDWPIFTEEGKMEALYDPTSGYLIVLKKDIIKSFEELQNDKGPG